jgi:hypothetical protein
MTYSDGEWRAGDEDATGEFLVIDIHDSDIATVDHAPATAAGRFYLGYQPRTYFENPDASEPVDNEAEAASFAAWAREVLGVEVAAADVLPLLAVEGEIDARDDFVEETVSELLKLVGLPVPQEIG